MNSKVGVPGRSPLRIVEISDCIRFSLDVVADLAGISFQQLVQFHSLGPYLVGGCYANGRLSPDTPYTSFYRDTRAQARTARFCLACCEEDIAFHGRAYYRRNHQLPGVNWCSKHSFRRLLSSPRGCHGFSLSPDQWGRLSEPEEVPNWETMAPVLRSFLSEFIQSSEDLAAGYAYIDGDLIRERWRELRVHFGKSGPTLMVKFLTQSGTSCNKEVPIPLAWIGYNSFGGKDAIWEGYARRPISIRRTSSWTIFNTICGVELKRFKEAPMATQIPPLVATSNSPTLSAA